MAVLRVNVLPRYPVRLRNKALRLYASGQSAADVAARLGLKRETVKQWLRTFGCARSMSEAAALSVARRPRGLRGHKIYWQSPKASDIQIADSRFEAQRMRQLDQDPRVARWQRCRDRICYVDHDGRSRIYVPDLAILCHDAERIVEEIKPMRFVTAGEAKWIAAAQFYERYGVRFRLVTEHTLGPIAHDLDPPEVREAHKARCYRLRQKREAHQRETETPEARRQRLSILAARKRQARHLETPERRQRRLERSRRWYRTWVRKRNKI